jgi:hypothetical protein
MPLTSIMPAQMPQMQTPQAPMTGQAGRYIIVVGQGEATFEPDMARIILGVEVSDPDVMNAVNEANTTTANMIAALAEAGVADGDIQTMDYNVRTTGPAVDGPPAPDAAERYVVESRIRVTVRDLDDLGDVLSAAIGAGANQVFALSLSAADTAPLQAEARERAVQDAQERAQAYAQLYGVEVGAVVSVSEIVGAVGMPFADGMGGAAGPPPVAPGEGTFTAQVQVVYELR